MKKKLWLILPPLLGLGAILCSGQTYPASQDVRVQVASLTQDVRLLSQQVGSLKLEVERLQRENEELRQQLVQKKALEDRLAQVQVGLNATLSGLRQEWQAADKAQRDAIISEVTKQITDLARQTQDTLEALGKLVGMKSSTAAAAAPTFAEDFPKNGVVYTVLPGDTLDSIARKHGSTVRDIQNANKIADPRQLRAGETIFVPQKN